MRWRWDLWRLETGRRQPFATNHSLSPNQYHQLDFPRAGSRVCIASVAMMPFLNIYLATCICRLLLLLQGWGIKLIRINQHLNWRVTRATPWAHRVEIRKRDQIRRRIDGPKHYCYFLFNTSAVTMWSDDVCVMLILWCQVRRRMTMMWDDVRMEVSASWPGDQGDQGSLSDQGTTHCPFWYWYAWYVCHAQCSCLSHLFLMFILFWYHSCTPMCVKKVLGQILGSLTLTIKKTELVLIFRIL